MPTWNLPAYSNKPKHASDINAADISHTKPCPSSHSPRLQFPPVDSAASHHPAKGGGNEVVKRDEFSARIRALPKSYLCLQALLTPSCRSISEFDVSPHVLTHVANGRESLATMQTAVRFFAGVRSHVCHQIARRREGLSTCLA